jgi:hypothetical protein
MTGLSHNGSVAWLKLDAECLLRGMIAQISVKK